MQIIQLFLPWQRVARFLIVGVTSTAVTAGTLFVLITHFNMWYLTASIISYSLGLFVSFTLQKFWTFQDDTLHKVGIQLGFYVFLTLFNLGLNTVLIYCFVEFLGLYPIIAQVFTSALIACESFFIYRIIFSVRETERPSEGILN